MEFSEKEVKMFTGLGYGDLVERFEEDPLSLYKVAAMDCFMHDLRGKYVDSLRKCMLVLKTGVFYRGTEQWDSLIED